MTTMLPMNEYKLAMWHPRSSGGKEMMELVKRDKCADKYKEQFPLMSEGDQESFIRIELEAELNKNVIDWSIYDIKEMGTIFGTYSWAHVISKRDLLDLEVLITELVLEGLNAEQ